MNDSIVQYYENYDENSRLICDNSHQIEYLTTIRYFDNLFEPNSTILDTCAGTGKYSLYLADKGHKVTSLDLTEHNINIIKSKPNADKLVDIDVCNVLELSQSKFGKNSFDIVLCMGALYHLKTDEERKKAILQCVQVLKKGGLLVLAYINKVGTISFSINHELENINELIKILDNTDEGIFTCTTPKDIEKISSECGIERVYNIGIDGLSYIHSEKINSASEENFNKFMEYHFATCEDENIIGSSVHGLYIGRK